MPKRQEGRDETAARERIIDAAFRAFMKNGYATTSTLEIATRARVSKRELYSLVGNKQEMLVACISERAKRKSTCPLTCRHCAIARPWRQCWLPSGRSSSAKQTIPR